MNTIYASTNENARPSLLRFRELYPSVFVAEDTDMPECVLATYVTNIKLLQLDPLWLLVVAPPSSGKTASLELIRGFPKVFQVSTITEAALLSGSPKREISAESTGGILRQIGDRGVIVCKDFTTILSMNKDKQGSVFSALREIYDGSWTRAFGADGGKILSWEGHVGFIGAVTQKIDDAHNAMSSMGERFILIRLLSNDTLSADLARRALENQTAPRGFNKDLLSITRAICDLVEPQEQCNPLPSSVNDLLVALASTVANVRGAVERDGYNREIRHISSPEAPGRLARQFGALFQGLLAIGNSADEAWLKVRRVGLDTIPELRRRVVFALRDDESPQKTSQVAEKCHYPDTTTRHALEELHYIDLLDRQSDGRAETWNLKEKLDDFLQAIQADTAEEDVPFSVSDSASYSPENEQTPSITVPAHTERRFRVSKEPTGSSVSRSIVQVKA